MRFRKQIQTNRSVCPQALLGLGLGLLLLLGACSPPDYERQLTNGSAKKWGLKERTLAEDEKEGIGLWGFFGAMATLDKILEFRLEDHRVHQWYSMYPISDNTLVEFDFSTPPELSGTWKLYQNKIRMTPLHQGDSLSITWEIEVHDPQHLTLQVLDENQELWMTENYTALE